MLIISSSEHDLIADFTDIISPTLAANISSLNLKASSFDTPLGPMIAVASDDALYLLEFLDKPKLKSEITKFVHKICSTITPGSNDPLKSIEAELQAYFAGELKEFKTPLQLQGSPFQKSAWDALMNIPYGETRSYQGQATAIGLPKAYRAVANANGANKICIVIPCHRIINSNGKTGGYGGGIERKIWLLEHEKRFIRNNR